MQLLNIDPDEMRKIVKNRFGKIGANVLKVRIQFSTRCTTTGVICGRFGIKINKESIGLSNEATWIHPANHLALLYESLTKNSTNVLCYRGCQVCIQTRSRGDSNDFL